MLTYTSHGKLLLTGEYVVLDGALSLALPTKFGQSLVVNTSEDNHIKWKSLDHNNTIWFEATFKLYDGKIQEVSSNEDNVSRRLIQILNVAKQLNPLFLNDSKGVSIITTLNFMRNWGLGTSSTLINNIATWANIDAYKLLEFTFGGSGYDIACAQHSSPITYQLNGVMRQIETVNFKPKFKEHLYFVYLNKKQNSRDSIAKYNTSKQNLNTVIPQINNITSQMITCDTLSNFELLISKHEQLISSIINLKSVKELYFSDFNGAMKSLGGWGGDFILVTSQSNPSSYFSSRGYHTIIPYSSMIA